MINWTCIRIRKPILVKGYCNIHTNKRKRTSFFWPKYIHICTRLCTIQSQKCRVELEANIFIKLRIFVYLLYIILKCCNLHILILPKYNIFVNGRMMEFLSFSFYISNILYGYVNSYLYMWHVNTCIYSVGQKRGLRAKKTESLIASCIVSCKYKTKIKYVFM